VAKQNADVTALPGLLDAAVAVAVALPAHLMEGPKGPHPARASSPGAVAGAVEEQARVGRADHTALWGHRPADLAADPAPLLDAIAALDWPMGGGFVWIAAEAGVVRALRAQVLEVRGRRRGRGSE
jgi:NADPH-dependent ferric siderophore reductase